RGRVPAARRGATPRAASREAGRDGGGRLETATPGPPRTGRPQERNLDEEDASSGLRLPQEARPLGLRPEAPPAPRQAPRRFRDRARGRDQTRLPIRSSEGDAQEAGLQQSPATRAR